jgi:acetyl esterase/lipase
MSQHILILLALTIALPWPQSARAQEAVKQADSYSTEKEIAYLPENQSDDYARERCRLDLYYPKELKNFPTVVWFHGGGLTGGSKAVPEALKNKGVAVVAVNYRLSPKAKSPAYIEDAAAAVACETIKSQSKDQLAASSGRATLRPVMVVKLVQGVSVPEVPQVPVANAVLQVGGTEPRARPRNHRS